MNMQKIATKVFVCASLAFGVIGIVMVIVSPMVGGDNSDVGKILQQLLMITVFIILPSFALSVASKYLNGKS